MPNFDARSAKRIAKVVRDAERSAETGGVGPRRNNPTANLRTGCFVSLTTPCTAATGTLPAITLGVGAGLILFVEGGVTSSSGETVPIYNVLTDTIAAGLYAAVWIDGHPTIVLGDCP